MELLDNGMKVIPVRVHLPLQQGLRLSNFRVVWQAAPHVRVHLPLQQGLRPACTMADCSSIVSASASSITTRIKTLVSPAFRMFDDDVRVHLPLQQGLRPFLDLRPDFFFIVRVHLPLQQGLRHLNLWPLRFFGSCASASSITTRIKTPVKPSIFQTGVVSASASSITTRIKTRAMAAFSKVFTSCECIFHYNKD